MRRKISGGGLLNVDCTHNRTQQEVPDSFAEADGKQSGKREKSFTKARLKLLSCHEAKGYRGHWLLVSISLGQQVWICAMKISLEVASRVP